MVPGVGVAGPSTFAHVTPVLFLESPEKIHFFGIHTQATAPINLPCSC